MKKYMVLLLFFTSFSLFSGSESVNNIKRVESKDAKAKGVESQEVHADKADHTDSTRHDLSPDAVFNVKNLPIFMYLLLNGNK